MGEEEGGGGGGGGKTRRNEGCCFALSLSLSLSELFLVRTVGEEVGEGEEVGVKRQQTQNGRENF